MQYNYDMIPVPVSVRDKGGRYTYVNRAWSDMFSIAASMVPGKTDGDLGLDPLARPEGESWVGAGELAFRDVYITTREKGRLLLELIETRMFEGKAEEGTLCVHQDMTGIGWRMEDLSRCLSRSEYRQRQNTQHVVRMWGEMNTPLERVLEYCDRMGEGELSASQREQLATIRDNARLLRQSVQRGIDLTVVEEEQGEGITGEPVKIDALLAEIRELYSGLAGEKNVAIECTISDELNCPYVMDRSRVRQIVVNMLDSAFRSATGGKIHIEATKAPGGDRPLCIKVRVDETCDIPVVEGSGEGCPRIIMGLSHKIVRALCGMIGGRYEISSEQDGARTQKVYLRTYPAKAARRVKA
jgi:signal transduction histidine kinase